MKHLLALLVSGFLSLAVWAANPVDINQATADEIATGLNGIGLSKAEAIVRYREENGPFEHIDELVNVKGIGLKTVDRNRDFILLGPGSPGEAE